MSFPDVFEHQSDVRPDVCDVKEQRGDGPEPSQLGVPVLSGEHLDFTLVMNAQAGVGVLLGVVRYGHWLFGSESVLIVSAHII
jgi:hypothetical protein